MKFTRTGPLVGALLIITVLTTSGPALASSTPAPQVTTHSRESDTSPRPMPSRRPGQLQLGAVVASAEMVLSPDLAAVATAKRISYVSSDPDGQHIVVTGAILTPRVPSPGVRDVVAWAHGTEGLADRCAPSRFAGLSSDPSFGLYAASVTSLLRQGWTVAATDYAGLGSPGPHPYLVGDSEGRAIIDSVRAARRLDRSLSNEWAAVGHSQGGQGALFAGELARTYGKELALRGVVGIASAGALDQLAATIAGTPGQGYLVMALYGLAALDDTVHPDQLLAPPALSRTPVLETDCFLEVIGAFADLKAKQLLVDGALPPQILAAVARNNPGQRQVQAPVLLLQGEADETVPSFVADDLLVTYCGQGTVAAIATYADAGHDSVLIPAIPDAVGWIDDRFDGDPARSDCTLRRAQRGVR